MTLKLLSAAALTLALMGGAAYAQTKDNNNTPTASTTTNDASDATEMKFLNNNEKMGAFYTDSSMGTLRADDEIRAAWNAMTDEDRTAMRSDCEALGRGGDEKSAGDPASPSVLKLCGNIGTF